MEYLLKASTVVAIFYICYKLFLQRETFFESNRWFLLVGLVIAFAIPFIAIPVYITQEISTLQGMTFSNENTGAAFHENNFDWQSLIPIIYLVGFVFFLFRFLLQFGSLILLLLKNKKEPQGYYTYIIVKSDTSPFSFFKWIIYNPNLFNKEELDLIINHEKVHVNQYHSFDTLLTQLTCVIFWFNPIIWFYKKDLLQNLEYIADNRVQEVSDCNKTYQRLLLKTSTSHYNLALTNNFYNSLIKKRIIMLNKSKSKSFKKWKFAFTIPMLVIFLMSFNTKPVYKTKIGKKNTSSVIDNISQSTEKDNLFLSISDVKKIEFIVTKNTSDNTLDLMIKEVKNKGGKLAFKDIKRNNNGEIINIFVSLYGKLGPHSYGGGDGKNPIKSFIIYKELYGDGAGYVGGINNGTMHFDVLKESKKGEIDITRFSKKIKEVILNKGIKKENEINLNRGKNKSSKSSNIQDKSTSLQKKYAIASTTNISEIEKVIITKDFTDDDFKKAKEKFAKLGVTLKFKNIKRNKDGEIIELKSEFKTLEGNSGNVGRNGSKPISPFTFYYNTENGEMGYGSPYEAHQEHGDGYAYEIKSGKTKIYKSGKGNNVFVYSHSSNKHDGDHEIIEDDNKIIIKRGHKMHEIKKSNKSNNTLVISSGDGKLIELKGEAHTDGVVIDLKGEAHAKGNVFVYKKDKKGNIVKEHKDKSGNVETWTGENANMVYEYRSSDEKDNNKIFFRGNDGKEPLFILDGKKMSKKQFDDESLDPNTIKSVNVLKGAAAKKLYGKKAKNGAIVITTKNKD